MVLVRTLDEQALLEHILDASKPPLPDQAGALHWLLFTPFRYPPLPHGSRFRSGQDAGVFYAADELRTACAELGYWRWRFLADSELLQIGPLQQTVFETMLAGKSIDLRVPPFDRERASWTAASDYGPCQDQDIARKARRAGVQLLRYESVRDPLQAGCVAVLSHAAFAQPVPMRHQTWNLLVTRERVLWQEDSIFGGEAFEFDTGQWTSPGRRAAESFAGH